MSDLEVSGLRKDLAGRAVLSGVDLSVPSGAITALLGASGCGKTTLLRLIAGFEPADGGRVVLDGQVVDADGRHVPAERRRVGYVPQEGLLFPHLTVEGNIGFGLPRRERRGGRVAAMLELTGLDGLGGRYPHQLSGGQQQRAALARALAPDPRLVLLDEPFNALDMALRRSVCADVVAVLRRAGATALLVTHDPQEAFASADVLAVMAAGTVAQVGAPAAVYRRPASPAVARLTGPAIFLDGLVEYGVAQTALGRIRLDPASARPTGASTVLLRPEQIGFAAAGVVGNVVSCGFRGDHLLVTVEIGGLRLDVPVAGEARFDPGQTLHLAVTGPAVAFDPP